MEDLILPPVEQRPWRFRDFPILAWWAPPGDARVEDFEAYREAGFTLHATNCDTNFFPALDKLRQSGLRSLVFRTHQNFASSPAAIDFDALNDREEIVGWITHDIPSGKEAVADAVREINKLLQADPSRRALCNLLPPQAQHNPSTAEIIETAVRCGTPILSYYHYVLHRDGSTSDTAFYNNLGFFRDAAIRHNISFWAFALSIGHWGYRRPSQSDLRWQQFSNLAYGAKGLWYFTYWAPLDWDDWDPVAIVDPENGAPTELYPWVKEINRSVLKESALLADLTGHDLAHTNPPPGQPAFEPGRFWIEEIEAKDALVSFSRDAAGVRHAWVVNKLHGMGNRSQETADRLRLRFSSAVSRVEPLLWLDGPEGEVVWDNREAEFSLAGGTGILLRAS